MKCSLLPSSLRVLRGGGRGGGKDQKWWRAPRKQHFPDTQGRCAYDPPDTVAEQSRPVQFVPAKISEWKRGDRRETPQLAKELLTDIGCC